MSIWIAAGLKFRRIRIFHLQYRRAEGSIGRDLSHPVLSSCRSSAAQDAHSFRPHAAILLDLGSKRGSQDCLPADRLMPLSAGSVSFLSAAFSSFRFYSSLRNRCSPFASPKQSASRNETFHNAQTACPAEINAEFRTFLATSPATSSPSSMMPSMADT
jgi:hypothetical protein